MDRTTALGFGTDANGRRIFVNQDLAAGVDGTDADAEFFNVFVEEFISGLIEFVGMAPNAGDSTQVRQAIIKLVTGLFSSAFNLSSSGVSGTTGSSYWRISPDGFVEQGGYVNNPGATNVAVTFPIPFPSGQGPILDVTCANSVTTPNGLGTYNDTATGFSLSQTQPLSFFWKATWH